MSRERIQSLIERYVMLNRVPVSDDTSLFVRELGRQLEAPVWSVRSGTECLTWVIPPKWTVNEAFLASRDGLRIGDFAEHPLYLKSYSAPYEGSVSRDDLISHVFTDPDRPERILYDCRAQYGFGQRTAWGFSLPYRTVAGLDDAAYDVRIDVTFGEGEMDVLDWTLPGKTDETILFAAHTCHPAQVNDGIACVAVLAELFRWLREREPRRYTYRLVLGPEYFAAAAVLAKGDGVDQLRAGVFLDMPGNGRPLGFSRSFAGDALIDRVVRNVVTHQVPAGFERGYRGLWGNDEMFYDGPDFGIPTTGIGRAMWPYYHTDADNLKNCDFAQLDETLSVLREIVEIIESDAVLKRAYKGPLYQSRYNLYIDPKLDRSGYDNLQACQIMMDGSRSYLDIASALDIDVRFVRALGGQLIERHLAEVIGRPSR